MLKQILVLMAGCLLMTPSAWPVEALSTAELVSHCDKYYDDTATEDRTFCVRYIQGFIDGAVATDERVMKNIVRQYEEEESFSQRAARTRIGSRLQRRDATYYAEFCLGDPVLLKEVVEHVVNDANSEEIVAANPLARDLVYQTLRNHDPCSDSG